MTLPLSARIESATADMEREMCEHVFVALIPAPITTGHIRNERQLLAMKFGQILDARAYLCAAILIFEEVLPGWSYTMSWLARNKKACAALFHPTIDESRAEASTPTLALLAAIMKVMEAKDG